MPPDLEAICQALNEKFGEHALFRFENDELIVTIGTVTIWVDMTGHVTGMASFGGLPMEED